MVRLSTEEVAFFKEYGYLIKRNLLDKDLCRKARDELWKSMPPTSSIKRTDPSSWVGPVPEEDECTEDRDNARPDGGHNPDLRNFRWQAHYCGSLEWMKHLLATNKEVMEIAEQLLGKGNVAEVESIRGVYCTLPVRACLGCIRARSADQLTEHRETNVETNRIFLRSDQTKSCAHDPVPT
eukprot:SAG31_NODE_1752_length_7351_cov_29.035852_6_plen_181_part_00